MEPILKVKGLKTEFYTINNKITAVDDVSFSVKRKETLAIVGESGSGKSVTSLSIMGLIMPPGKISGGEIEYNGKNLLSLKEKEMQQIRGNEISMIFQEPMTSLNPVLTIGKQISEALRKHQKISIKDSYKKVIELLQLVEIPSPEQRIKEYPYQLSGGMRQRVMIAIALASNPKILIADEPTTALDVTIQAQILDLMKNVKEKMGMSIIIITHDLGVVAEIADRVVVMYAGKVVEQADVVSIFNNPLHPYTKRLLASSLTIDKKLQKFPTIKGNVPHPSQLPKGCRFHPRCELATKQCSEKEPILEMKRNNREVRCWYAKEE